MLDKQIIALIRLSLIPGLGPVGSRKLLQYFERPAAIFTGEWPPELPGLSERLLAALRSEHYLKQAESYLNRAYKMGIGVLSFEDEQYPFYLNQCPDAPLVLYCKGEVRPMTGSVLALVGTRKMTPYGQDFCRQFIQDLRAYNPTIVSGLAYGVDICGQRAAVKNGLQTIACLAHGLDFVYPRTHEADARQIMGQGGLISEFPPGTRPKPEYFLRRNRIIAGMAQATVVIETPEAGGSLVTADHALGYHREVFAVPGRLNDPISAGCNRLIAHQRAQLLRSAEELAALLNWKPVSGSLAPSGEKSPQAERETAFFGPGKRPKSAELPLEPMHKETFPALWSANRVKIATWLQSRQKCQLNELLSGTNIPPALLNQELILMELEGLIRVYPGKMYCWIG